MSIKFESFKGTGGGAVTGGLVYKGSYNATTSSPSLVTAKKGDFYIVSVAGTLAGITLNVGDHIVFNQDAANPVTSAMFDTIDNTDAVASVNSQTGVVVLNAANVGALAITSNLSDLNNAVTARTNLGLGTAAVKDHGTTNGDLVLLDAVGLPAVDGSQLTGITATDNTKLAILNNLSDLTSATSGRLNLGLGTAAVKDHGTTNGDLVLLDAVGLPAVDGSQLTGVTGTDATKLAIANNLSDLNNATTARANLGLGTSATLDVGTSANNVIQLDGSSRLPAVDGSQLTNLPSGASETLQQVTDNGATTTTNISVAQVTMGGDLLADGNQTRTIASETNRFITAHSDLNGAVRFKAKAGVALSKGDVVYISGVSGGVPTVAKAQANSASTMPAFGLCHAAASLNAEVQIVSFGNLEGLNTASLAVGDTLFISSTTAGTVTNTAPTGEANFVQNIGRVVKIDAVGNSGIYKIGGAGRTNATPNLNTDKIFLGNGSNQAVSTALSAISLSSFNNDLTTNIVLDTTPQLGGSLDVNGQDIVSVSNGAIELAPDGTGKVTIKGNATSGSGQIVLNCEQNSHGISLKGPPHSAAASYTLTFPNTDGNADQVLKSDGSGNLDWVDQASGGGGLTYQARTTASHSPLTPAADYHYSINADSATFIVNLPALSSLTDGQQIRFKLQARGNAAYDVTINRAGSDTIDGATSQTLSVTYSSITLVVGSTEWEIV